MTNQPSRKAEFERMLERHREEMERDRERRRYERQAFEAKYLKLRDEITAARLECERAMLLGPRAAFEAARRFAEKFGGLPDFRDSKRRRRRPGLEGGEPVPVEPRPRPTPLQHGAEAPIE